MLWAKLLSEGLHFPYLTALTVVAIISGLIKFKKADVIFLVSSCLWVILSSETIGFVLFFDNGNYERMLFGLIPLLLGSGLFLFINSHINLVSSWSEKLFLLPLLVLIGIGSYVYKPSFDEVNCWYYFNEGKTYKVLFAQTPEHKFAVELSSDSLRKKVKVEAIQYEGLKGYYCPETKIKVITSFGQVFSAKIISFRNSEIDKKVIFDNPIKIPISEVSGEIEILKPYALTLWN